MTIRWVRLAGPLLVGTLALAACTDGSGEGGGTTGTTGSRGPTGPVQETLQVEASEFAFEPSDLTASPDTVTAIEVENVGRVEHDLVIDQANLRIVAAASESAEGRFSLPAGTYPFYCSIPGHLAAGMEGTLTIG